MPLHTVEVSFAEAEAMTPSVRISSKVRQLVLGGNITQVQNTSVDVIRDDLKPEREMFAGWGMGMSKWARNVGFANRAKLGGRGGEGRWDTGGGTLRRRDETVNGRAQAGWL